jgi:hypothetical protein
MCEMVSVVTAALITTTTTTTTTTRCCYHCKNLTQKAGKLVLHPVFLA